MDLYIGTFDMFNIDDLDRIKNAREKCEILTVGIYTDELSKIINKKEPIIKCEDRKRIVFSIKGVDNVISLDNINQLKEKKDILRSMLDRNNFAEYEEDNEKPFKIGFIQGTFDMFHTGHLNLINRAKLQCERLIVGVNTDRLVKEYKNKVPIVRFEDRIKIVEAIKGVDEVVEMNDRNKIKAARELNFDALIMGNDWQGTEFYNIMEEELKRLGVQVVYLPYTQGISSTVLRRKIGKDANGNNIEEGFEK